MVTLTVIMKAPTIFLVESFSLFSLLFFVIIRLHHIPMVKTIVFVIVTKPLARLLEPLRIATILNIYLSNGM